MPVRTWISEAQLIEMRSRFDKLEASTEVADLILAARQEAFRLRMAHLDGERIANRITYQEYTRRYSEADREHGYIAEARSDIERALEACREDFTRMQAVMRER